MSLEEIKQTIKSHPISMVIGHYISLKRSGSTIQAVCPFHNDTNPSMSISDQKGMYRCWACNASGDAIQFVRNKKNYQYMEAIKEICDILHISTDTLEKKEANPKLEMSKRVLTSAIKLYRKIALNSALPYQEFISKRKLPVEIADTFQIGYAPHGNVFYNYLKSIPGKDQQFAIQIADEIGIIKKYQNDYQDFFTSRIMIPVWDQYGQPIGFTSRATLDSQKAKYMNSKESPIYNKGKTLYALHFARNFIREKNAVILVEGNMDVITLHKAGFKNTVGSMGTAVTEYQLNLLKPLTQNVYLCLDNDTAGKIAAIKTNQLLLKHSIMAKVITIAPYKDPDDFINSEGGMIEFQNKIDHAPYFIDEMIKSIASEVQPSASSNEKILALQKIFQLLSPLKLDLQATERVANAAKTLGIFSDVAVLTQNYAKFLEENSKTLENTFKIETKAAKVEEKLTPALNETPSANSVPNLQKFVLSKEEKIFLQELLINPSIFKYLPLGELLDFIRNNEVKLIVQWLKDFYQEISDEEYVDTIRNFVVKNNINLELQNAIETAFFDYAPQKNDEKKLNKLAKDLTKKIKFGFYKIKKMDLIDLQSKELDPMLKKRTMEEIIIIDKELLKIKKDL